METEEKENKVDSADLQLLLRSIGSNLRGIIILLLLILICLVLLYFKLDSMTSGLTTVANRLDLITSAIENGIIETIASIDNGMEQIYNRMGEMRIY